MGSYNCCTTGKVELGQVKTLSSLLKLVGVESRLQILCILRLGKHCVCEIEKHVRQSQSLISHHLKDLKNEGLITEEKKGQWVYYSMTEKGQTITKALFDMKL